MKVSGFSFKRFVISSLIIVSVLTTCAQPLRKVLFVIVDGIPSDVIEKLPTPSLDFIAGKTGYTRAHVGGIVSDYTQTPTISAVGYNSLLTGTWVNKHNVWDNDILKPNYNYQTIFRLLKSQYPKKKIAVFSSWEDNRTKLIGEGMKITGNIKMDYTFDGLENDTARFPHDSEKNYMHRIDEAVVDKAAQILRSEAPDLSWVYLEYTDDMGHMFGDSEQFYNAVKQMDNQIGRLWHAIQYRVKNNHEEWQIYITTDHGRDSVNGKGHGNQSSRERSIWIVTNAESLNDYYKTGNPGIVDIMPSIARFLNVRIPRQQLMEIDGIALTGKLSAIEPSAVLSHNKINISWKAIERSGSAKLWVAATNNFSEGKNDVYVLHATVPVTNQQATIDVSKYPSRFYKVVIETPYNFLNRWVRTDDK